MFTGIGTSAPRPSSSTYHTVWAWALITVMNRQLHAMIVLGKDIIRAPGYEAVVRSVLDTLRAALDHSQLMRACANELEGYYLWIDSICRTDVKCVKIRTNVMFSSPLRTKVYQSWRLD